MPLSRLIALIINVHLGVAVPDLGKRSGRMNIDLRKTYMCSICLPWAVKRYAQSPAVLSVCRSS